MRDQLFLLRSSFPKQSADPQITAQFIEVQKLACREDHVLVEFEIANRIKYLNQSRRIGLKSELDYWQFN